MLKAKDRKHSIKAVEWDLWQVYVSSSLGAAFNYACVALYFESAVLVAHPVPEVRVLHHKIRNSNKLDSMATLDRIHIGFIYNETK